MMKDITEIHDSGCSDMSEDDKSPAGDDSEEALDFTFRHNLVISSSNKKGVSDIYSDIRKLGGFMRLPQRPDQVQCTYIWIDGSSKSMRLKDSTLPTVPQSLDELPVWTFDGSSTGQAKGKNSDVLLRPVALFSDPLRGGFNRLVLCETLDHNNQPIDSNKRHAAAVQMAKRGLAEASFVIRQQFKLTDRDGDPPSDIGCNFSQILHDACVYAGVEVQPMDSEGILAVGPCRGLEAGDHLWMARFLLHRIAEDFGLAAVLPDSECSNLLGIDYLEDLSLSVDFSPDKLPSQHEIVYDFSQGVSNAVTSSHDLIGCFRQRAQLHCTYVWIEGTSEAMRSKTRLLGSVPASVNEIPKFHLNDTVGRVLLPVAMYQDPFRQGDSKLVLCEVVNSDGKPTGSNLRAGCAAMMRAVSHLQPWFGIEQEYVLFKGPWPLGWRTMTPPEGSDHYCGLGASMLGRHVAEAHYRACLYAGIKIAGTNAEVLPAQWEFQVGPCEGIAAGDDLWMARFLLHVVAHHFGMSVSFDPKPVPGPCNGSGAHTNFSTTPMREAEGLREIERAIERLSHHHSRHIKAYDPSKGKDNARRLTGSHETASIDRFSSGVANRAVSIRIPRNVALEGKGYFEDRRPSANCDPYSVTEVLIRTAVLDQ